MKNPIKHQEVTNIKLVSLDLHIIYWRKLHFHSYVFIHIHASSLQETITLLITGHILHEYIIIQGRTLSTRYLLVLWYLSFSTMNRCSYSRLERIFNKYSPESEAHRNVQEVGGSICFSDNSINLMVKIILLS